MQHHGMPDFTIFLQHNAHPTAKSPSLAPGCPVTRHQRSWVLAASRIGIFQSLQLLLRPQAWDYPGKRLQLRLTKATFLHWRIWNLQIKIRLIKSTKRIYTQILRGIFCLSNKHPKLPPKIPEKSCPKHIPSTNFVFHPSIFRKRRRLYSVKGRWFNITRPPLGS